MRPGASTATARLWRAPGFTACVTTPPAAASRICRFMSRIERSAQSTWVAVTMRTSDARCRECCDAGPEPRLVAIGFVRDPLGGQRRPDRKLLVGDRHVFFGLDD